MMTRRLELISSVSSVVVLLFVPARSFAQGPPRDHVTLCAADDGRAARRSVGGSALERLESDAGEHAIPAG